MKTQPLGFLFFRWSSSLLFLSLCAAKVKLPSAQERYNAVFIHKETNFDAFHIHP